MTEQQEQIKAAEPHPVFTINAQGKIIGDLSGIPAETLEKLQTPEAQERMKAMYRKEFGSDRRTLNRKIHRDPETEQRDFRNLCPPGMSNKEFRKIRRKFLREQTKSVLKEMRHGHNADSNSRAQSV